MTPPAHPALRDPETPTTKIAHQAEGYHRPASHDFDSLAALRTN